jgi:hypothetical protein
MNTGAVDWTDPAANMYGCLPCPGCASETRAAYREGRDAGMVVCDDCGFCERATFTEDEP